MSMETKIVIKPVRLSCLQYQNDSLLKISPSEQFACVGVQYEICENGNAQVADIAFTIPSAQSVNYNSDELHTLLPRQMKQAVFDIICENESRCGNSVDSVTLPNGEELIETEKA